MSQKSDPMLGEVRFRVPLPVLIPLGAVVVIGLLTFGFSRVLLAIPPEAATTVATVTAINILGACAVLALRPEMTRNSMIELAVVLIYPIIIGIALTQLNIGAEESHAEAPPPAGESEEGSGGPVTSGGTISAENVQFSADTIELQAGEQVSLTLDNQDQLPHNLAIYEDQAGADAQQNPIFQGELVTGTTVNYEFEAPPSGEYPFQCDVHPAMSGTVTVR
jgi:plastocyanin